MHLEDHTMLDTKLVLVMFSLLLIKVLIYLFVRFFVLICAKKNNVEKNFMNSMYINFFQFAGRDSPLKHLVCHTISAAGPHEALTYL